MHIHVIIIVLDESRVKNIPGSCRVGLYIYNKKGIKRVQTKNFREFLVLEGRESTPST